MTHTDTPDRRTLLLAGAAAGTAAAGLAAAQAPAPVAAPFGGLPDLYPGGNLRQFRALQRHENAHVAFLVSALGAAARPRPTFTGLEQTDLRSFASTALALENTGTGAYLGAAPAILSRKYLDAALSIAEIEARHCGFINNLFNRLMSQNVFAEEQSFERPLTIAEVTTLAGPFITNLNGGPPLTFSTTPSRANDIAILNFALALEYLEQDFYNINLTKFFGAA